MSLDGPLWLARLSTGLKVLATVLTALIGYYAFVLVPFTGVTIELFIVLSVTSFYDSFVVVGVRALIGLGRDWKRHFLPSVGIMHLGAAWALLTMNSSSLLWWTPGLIVFMFGFLACLNQYLTVFEPSKKELEDN